MASRTVDQEYYRFGFNGKENDNETYGTGNALDFGARIYDSRLGRWMSVDPSWHKYYSYTPYNYSILSPILYKDIDGKDIIVSSYIDSDGNTVINVTLTGVVSFDHYKYKFNKEKQEKYVINLNGYLKEIYTKTFKNEKIIVNFDSKLRLGTDPDITPKDNAVYVVSLTSGEFEMPKIDGGSVEGFVNGIGGKVAYFPYSNFKERTPLHEIGHWLCLLHPKEIRDGFIDMGGSLTYKNSSGDVVTFSNIDPEKVFGLFSYDNLMHHSFDKGTKPGGGYTFDSIQAQILLNAYNKGLLNKGDNKFNKEDFKIVAKGGSPMPGYAAGMNSLITIAEQRYQDVKK